MTSAETDSGMTDPSPNDSASSFDAGEPNQKVGQEAIVDAARGRVAFVVALLSRSLRLGIVGGLAFGWAQTLMLGLPLAKTMGPAQWIDALTFSGLAHGLLWASYGVVASLVLGVVGACSRRVRASLDPTPLATAVLAGAVTVFLAWPAAGILGVGFARGLEPPWCVTMGTVFLLTIVAAYVIEHWLASTRLGRFSGGTTRALVLPGLLLWLFCLGFQAYTWPAREGTVAAWRNVRPEQPRTLRARPNVLLVVIDTQRGDRLGCYGYERPVSPNIDFLAADGVVFDNCLAASTWTLPTHASLFTGLMPSEHGTTWDHRWLDQGFTTLAERLRQAGYQTIALSNNDWISHATNLSQGFDSITRPAAIHRPRSNSIGEFVEWVLRPAGLVGRWLSHLVTEDAGGRYTNQLAERWLTDRDPDRPFFLFINYMEPHDPYIPEMAVRKQFVTEQRLDAACRLVWDWERVVAYSLLGRSSYSSEERELINHNYDAEVRMGDARVGELLTLLARLGELENTLVILTSDHGENLGEHHLLVHAWSVHDTLAHVPLIIRYPGHVPPGRRSDLAMTVDIMPTILQAVLGTGTPTASTFGRPLLHLPATTQAATASASPQPLSERGRLGVVELMVPQGVGADVAQRLNIAFDRGALRGPMRAACLDQWKYVVGPAGSEALYNVAVDPQEHENLIESHRTIADHLRDSLRLWLKKAKRHVPAPLRKQDPTVPLDPAVGARLRNLGYIQ